MCDVHWVGWMLFVCDNVVWVPVGRSWVELGIAGIDIGNCLEANVSEYIKVQLSFCAKTQPMFAGPIAHMCLEPVCLKDLLHWANGTWVKSSYLRLLVELDLVLYICQTCMANGVLLYCPVERFNIRYTSSLAPYSRRHRCCCSTSQNS